MSAVGRIDALLGLLRRQVEVDTSYDNAYGLANEVLASDWLTQVKADAAAGALEDAASVWGADPDSVGDTARDYRNWLRDRAHEIRPGVSS